MPRGFAVRYHVGVRVLAVLSLLAAPRVGLALCDPAALTAARAEVAANCNCAGASSHRAYVRCATRVAQGLVADRALSLECKAKVRRCAVRSICGLSGFVACTGLSAAGSTTCQIEPDTAACSADGGTVSDCSSCCDAKSGPCGTASD